MKICSTYLERGKCSRIVYYTALCVVSTVFTAHYTRGTPSRKKSRRRVMYIIFYVDTVLAYHQTYRLYERLQQYILTFCQGVFL